jgi:DNA polymerase III sliding clamp (beta) subunit (PCNA family)
MGKKPAEVKPIKAKPVPVPGYTEKGTALPTSVPTAPATATSAPAQAAIPTPAAPAPATPAPVVAAAQTTASAPAPAPEPVIEEIDPNSLLPSAIETKALSKFKVGIDEISAFKSMIDVVSYLVDELLFAFSKDALHFTAIDSSHVAMLAVTLLKEYFADWQISNPCVFNTQVADFLKIMKRANAADNVSLEYDGKSDSKGDKATTVKFIEVHMSNGKSNRKFKIKGRDIDSGLTNGMEIDNALRFVKGFLEKSNETRVRFKIDIATLGEIVKDATLISDIVTLIGHKETKTVTFNALGDCGDYEVSMVAKDKGEIRDFKADIDTETIYSLMFIENILKMGNLCTEVTITSINQGPMLFDFQIIKGKKAVGNLLYLVAPRAHDDDMNIEEEGEDETAPDPAAGEEAGEDEAGEGEDEPKA